MGVERAEESRQVGKVRRKIEKQIKKEKEQINKDSLKQTKLVIEKWLNRQPDRIETGAEASSKKFNENKNPEEPKSLYVQDLLKKLKEESTREAAGLKGRVTAHESPDFLKAKDES